jgi:hypothetical protein
MAIFVFIYPIIYQYIFYLIKKYIRRISEKNFDEVTIKEKEKDNGFTSGKNETPLDF